MKDDTFFLLDNYIKENYKPYKRIKDNSHPLLRGPLNNMEPFRLDDFSSTHKNKMIYDGLKGIWSLDKLKTELSNLGFSLSMMHLSEVIIQFFFENEIYDFNLLNEALKKYNLSPFIRVGYQGLFLSNSYYASINYFKEPNIIFIPLLDSKSVVSNLVNKEIEFGVMAKANSITGIVKETEDALRDINYKFINKIDLPIHHSLFKRKDVDINELKYVGSHIQALLQTKGNRKKLIPNLKEVELKDTAIAAIDLKDGKLGMDYAIICNKNCGLANELDLIYENIEDDKNNTTSFIVISL